MKYFGALYSVQTFAFAVASGLLYSLFYFEFYYFNGNFFILNLVIFLIACLTLAHPINLHQKLRSPNCLPEKRFFGFFIQRFYLDTITTRTTLVLSHRAFYFNYLSLLGLEHIYISYFLHQPKKSVCLQLLRTLFCFVFRSFRKSFFHVFARLLITL